MIALQSIGRKNPSDDGWLLDDVSMQIHRGQQLAVHGPSGSGKTLLLRTIALLDEFDTGQLLWKNQPVQPRDVPFYRSRVIYVHQIPALIDGTVRDNLQAPLRLSAHATKKYRERSIVDLLSAVRRQPSFLDRGHADLSGGEAQIVALLRALQLEPEILLLDEPTASLDASTTELIEQLLREWSGRNPQRAVVWVTHDMDQAARVASTSARMSNGRLMMGGEA